MGWLMILIGCIREFMAPTLRRTASCVGRNCPLLGSGGRSLGVLWETLMLSVPPVRDWGVIVSIRPCIFFRIGLTLII